MKIGPNSIYDLFQITEEVNEYIKSIITDGNSTVKTIHLDLKKVIYFISNNLEFILLNDYSQKQRELIYLLQDEDVKIIIKDWEKIEKFIVIDHIAEREELYNKYLKEICDRKETINQFYQSLMEDKNKEITTYNSLKNNKLKLNYLMLSTNRFYIIPEVKITKDMQYKILINYPMAMIYFKDVKKSMVESLISRSGYNIEYIKNPDEDLQLLAISRHPDCIAEIKNPSYKVQLLAIEKEPESIFKISNPAPALQLIALNKIDFSKKHKKINRNGEINIISTIAKHINKSFWTVQSLHIMEANSSSSTDKKLIQQHPNYVSTAKLVLENIIENK